MLRSLLILCLSLSGVAAVPLRVVTFNIETNRDRDGKVTEALNEPGTRDYDTVRDILARIDADVVCLQEITNRDVSGGTNGGTNSDVHALATDLGLNHVLIPTTTGVFDFALRNAILSRYPFESIDEVGSATYQESIGAVGADGSRAKDITRAIPAIVVEVPDAGAPVTVITLHNKSSRGLSDRFRRAVELARLADYLDRNALNASDNIILTGDFNLSSCNRTFTSEPTSGLPDTWNRGIDIPLPITYSTDVDFYFPAPYNLVAIDARDVNGGDATFQSGGATLDYILPSPAVTVVGSEIYRSELDTSNTQGLTKFGSPLPSSVSADASDHWAVFADFELEGSIPTPTSYSLTDASPKVIAGFDNFAGSAPPGPWSSSNSDWQGFFNNQTAPANYAFDESGDRSVGLITNSTPTSFSATFDNDTSTTIQGLNFSYLVRQLTANDPGTDDSLTASLTIGGASPVALPGLDFSADSSNSLPFSESPSATIDGLSIAPSSSFTLTLTATQGPNSGGPIASEVFLNEIHYDNNGGDQGEFIEIVVSPAYTGELTDISVALYNQNGSNYDNHELASFNNFDHPASFNGYSIYFKTLPTNGLQNGDNDGLAIIVDGTPTAVLSYEGTFTAVDGPATGLTATDIGSQSGNGPVGFASLGLTGSGLDSSELTWTTFSETTPHSPGSVNPGQTLTRSSPLPSQAISFDNVTVCIAGPPDNDMDGDPDSNDPDDDNDQLPDTLEALLGTNPFLADSDDNGTLDGDEDSDGDGQSNLAEFLVILTDPADPNDRFIACLDVHPSDAARLALTFPTILGRNYQILSSQDPASLSPLTIFTGTGNELTFTIAPDSSQAKFFSVEVTLDDE